MSDYEKPASPAKTDMYRPSSLPTWESLSAYAKSVEEPDTMFGQMAVMLTHAINRLTGIYDSSDDQSMTPETMYDRMIQYCFEMALVDNLVGFKPVAKLGTRIPNAVAEIGPNGMPTWGEISDWARMSSCRDKSCPGCSINTFIMQAVSLISTLDQYKDMHPDQVYDQVLAMCFPLKKDTGPVEQEPVSIHVKLADYATGFGEGYRYVDTDYQPSIVAGQEKAVAVFYRESTNYGYKVRSEVDSKVFRDSFITGISSSFPEIDAVKIVDYTMNDENGEHPFFETVDLRKPNDSVKTEPGLSDPGFEKTKKFQDLKADFKARGYDMQITNAGGLFVTRSKGEPPVKGQVAADVIEEVMGIHFPGFNQVANVKMDPDEIHKLIGHATGREFEYDIDPSDFAKAEGAQDRLEETTNFLVQAHNSLARAARCARADLDEFVTDDTRIESVKKFGLGSTILSANTMYALIMMHYIGVKAMIDKATSPGPKAQG